MIQQTPTPPSISPRQMTLLRTVAYMAWSDGGLADEEVSVMLNRLSRIFAHSEAEIDHLQQELQAYLTQNIPLEELVPKLESYEERKLVLRLGYEVIRANTRSPGEEAINPEEAVAYDHLKQLLGLSDADVQQIQAEVEAEDHKPGDMVDTLTHELESFVSR